jgi:ribosomal protein S13
MPNDSIEESLRILRKEIERLDALGLSFAASLIRVAEIELQMRLHNVSEDEVDVLSFAANAVERERRVRSRPT